MDAVYAIFKPIGDYMGSPTTAFGRASVAVRMLKNQKELRRAFDDCFEQGDGLEVVRQIVARSKVDQPLKRAIIAHGCGNWLTDPQYDPPIQKQPTLF